MVNYTPASETILGSAFTGNDGETNRTYTITDDNLGPEATVFYDNSGLTKDAPNGFTFNQETKLITILTEVFDDKTITINYSIISQFAFDGTVRSRVRLVTVQENNETLLPDDLIDNYLTDAGLLQGSTDETALVYYAAYLLSSGWQSLGFVTRNEGVSLKPRDPQSLLDSYNARIKKLSGGGLQFKKVAVNKDFQYDDTTKSINNADSGKFS